MTRKYCLLAWLLNLAVPGAGLVLTGRVLLGVLAGLAWGLALGVAMALAAALPAQVHGGAAALGGAGLLAWASAQFALAASLRAKRRLAAGEGRDARFKDALVAYLQGRLDESRAICERLLREDPDDVEATLQLAALARRQGDRAAARRHLTRARYLDDEGRWDFEIDRELGALAEGRKPEKTGVPRLSGRS